MRCRPAYTEQAFVSTGYGHRKGFQYTETQWREGRTQEVTHQQMPLESHRCALQIQNQERDRLLQTRTWCVNLSNKGEMWREKFSWKISYQTESYPFPREP